MMCLMMCDMHTVIGPDYLLLRAAPAVLSMWPSKRKLDEEKSDMPVWLSKIVLAQNFSKGC